MAVATETIIRGETSTKSTFSASISRMSSRRRAETRGRMKRRFSSSGSLAWATTYSSSTSAVI